jgi:cellulose synthase/poly-beta-1,6-N-acetylglucosamine synthase-like glycosyltransferase
MNAVATGISLFFLAYFLLLDIVYAILFVISFWDSGAYVRRLAVGGEETILSSPFAPPISVIMPAFNEAASIVASVDAMRLLEYSQYEIVVVDDGSSDATLARLIAAYELVPTKAPLRVQITTQPVRAIYVSERIPNLVVISKEHAGKADALNAGINVARYPLVCTTDADAVLEKNALQRVARPFLERPRDTVAVAGVVRIVNGCTVVAGRVTQAGTPHNFLAALQTVEYLRAYLATRTALNRLGAQFLVAGAFGVFRKDALVDGGGFSTTTITEDLEVVFRLNARARRKGQPHRVVFIPDPVVWTEAPEDLKGLRSQRKRWHRGLLESLWSYRDIVCSPRFGAFGCLALPYLWLFEVGGAVVETAGYVVTVALAAAGVLNVRYFVLFLLLAVGYGIVLSVAAVLMDEIRTDRDQSFADIARLLACSVAENFGYRQLLAFWRLEATVEALLGRRAQWGAIQRKGFQDVTEES